MRVRRHEPPTAAEAGHADNGPRPPSAVIEAQPMATGTKLAVVTGLLPVLLISAPAGWARAGASFEGRGTDVRAGQGGHLGVENTIGDLLRHPAFAGFAHLILPWDDRASDEQMPLTRISSLLPYHSHVDAETVAGALNRMIDEVARGRTVFYRFYSEVERQQEPARGNTGLFFLRGRPGAPFAIVCPGGGFSYVGSVHEGFPHAAAISGMAYTGHSDHASAEPPTFVVVGREDGIAPPAIMERRVKALRKDGTPVEFHEYEGLGHGFGLGSRTSAEGWVFEAIRFWETSRGKQSMPSR